jgi:DNA (cytosine-5)-methyltransferase 1
MQSERTDQLHRLRTLHLFAGAGGGILGDLLLGHRPICAVEIEPYCQQVLSARQKDGFLPWFPIYNDVQTFDGRPWRGLVDVVSGGFPCQDISAAGKGAGISGERSGMWKHMARIIGEVRPRYVIVENSPVLTSRGLGVVLGDLAALGYDAEWGVLGAVHVGAPHRRERIWICGAKWGGAMADSDNARPWDAICTRRYAVGNGGADVAHATGIGQQGPGQYVGPCNTEALGNRWWQSEPDVGRVADGVAARVDRLKAIGNGQVPTSGYQLIGIADRDRISVQRHVPVLPE